MIRVITRAPVALVALAVLGATPAARAQNELSLKVGNTFVASAGFDLVSKNDLLPQVELTYSRELVRLWRGSLWVDATFMAGSAEASVFQGGLHTKALLQSITVGAVYKLPVWSWLVPRVRVGVGALIGTLQLTPSGEAMVSDHSGAFTGHALLGVELLWPRARPRSLTGGLVLEGGYVFSSALGFQLAPSADSDLRLIPQRAAELGSLVIHGGQLRVGAIVRF